MSPLLAISFAGLAFPFSAGLIAAFNPCGFAMLPTYLAFFLGQDGADDDVSLGRSILRGLIVGLTLTAGFVLVFGVLGIITSNFLSTNVVASRLPWVTMILGAGMVLLGLAMVFGYELKIAAPRLNKGGKTRELRSIFMFGVSYAVVSFGCTAPLIIGTVASSFTNQGFVDGVATFLAYALGMAAIVVVLTMSVAVARGALANKMRQVLPFVNRVSGVLLFFGGFYVAFYGWYEIRVLNDPLTPVNPVQRRVEELQATINNNIAEIGAGRFGLILLAIIGALVLFATVQSKRSAARKEAELKTTTAA